MKLKYLLYGCLVFFIGILVNLIMINLFQIQPENSYIAVIGFSTLYLAAVVFVSTLLFIDATKK